MTATSNTFARAFPTNIAPALRGGAILTNIAPALRGG